MSDELFDRTTADALTMKIVERLGERERKIGMIKRMENQDNRQRLNIGKWLTTAVAACLLLGLVITPLFKQQASPLDELGIATPELTTFRAATSPQLRKIVRLLQKGDFKALVKLVPSELKKSDDLLKRLESYDDEESEYEYQLELQFNCDLRWIYIYSLLDTGNWDEAIPQLEYYLQQECTIEHGDDANKLLKKIKGKN